MRYHSEQKYYCLLAGRSLTAISSKHHVFLYCSGISMSLVIQRVFMEGMEPSILELTKHKRRANITFINGANQGSIPAIAQ